MPDNVAITSHPPVAVYENPLYRNLVGLVGEELFGGDAKQAARLARLPDAVQVKLGDLIEAAETAHASLMATTERMQAARHAKRDSARTLEEARASLASQRKGFVTRSRPSSFGGLQPNIVEYAYGPKVYDDEETRILEDAARRTAAEYDRLVAMQQAQEAAWHAALRLKNACVAYTREHFDTLPDAMTTAATAARVAKVPALDRCATTLGTIREQVVTLQAARGRVEDAGQPLADATAALLAHVDAEKAKWAPATGAFLHRDRRALPEWTSGGAVPDPQHTGFAGFAIRYVADQLKAELVADLEAEHARRVGAGDLFLSNSEQAARLADLDQQLYALNVLEEPCVLTLSAAERKVGRRSDADPAAVLCVVQS